MYAIKLIFMEINSKNIFKVFTIIISIVALVFSFLAWQVNNKQFLSSARPYVIAENFGTLTNNYSYIPQPSALAIIVLNVPAKIIREEVIYYSDKNIVYNSTNTDEVLIPGNQMQYKRECPEEILNKPNLTRFVKIDYKWLSGSNEKYFFEASWKFNTQDKRWELEYQKAN